MITRLRRGFAARLRIGRPAAQPPDGRRGTTPRTEPERRIDEARERLRAEIPPPPDDAPSR